VPLAGECETTPRRLIRHIPANAGFEARIAQPVIDRIADRCGAILADDGSGFSAATALTRSSAAAVSGPTMPSGLSPFANWNAFTADSVMDPNTLSVTSWASGARNAV